MKHTIQLTDGQTVTVRAWFKIKNFVGIIEEIDIDRLTRREHDDIKSMVKYIDAKSGIIIKAITGRVQNIHWEIINE